MATGTGERRDLQYQGEAGTDDNNRFYVIQESDPGTYDPKDDIVVINTSKGEVVTLEPPLRDPPESGLIFWCQLF